MDIVRKGNRTARLLRRGGIVLGIIAVLLCAATWVHQMDLTTPSVDRQSLLIGTVQRGEMVRNVRALGTLVPRQVQWITASSEGWVKRIAVEPGREVTTQTVLIEMMNPDLELEVANAEWALHSAEAALRAERARSRNAVLAMEATIAQRESAAEILRQKHDANQRLAAEGIVPNLEMNVLRIELVASRRQLEIEKRRLDTFQESELARLAVEETQVEQARALLRLKQNQMEGLQVRAGVAGIVEERSESAGEGKWVNAGSVLARISNPANLKAVLKVPEAQARDVAIGQTADIEVLNRHMAGHVFRVDPKVIEGTVAVDVLLKDLPPRGARSDLMITGTIEIARMNDVVFVDRPVNAAEDSTFQVFKLSGDGILGTRVPVRTGRGSASTLEVVAGLEPGDQIILSDMTRWEKCDRLRIQ